MDVIDLNCDMGESFGAWVMGSDPEMLKIVSSANSAEVRSSVSSSLWQSVAILTLSSSTSPP